jgi:hypothetical protein
LGLWGYRKQNSYEHWSGGAWLALITLKPQLAIAPCLWAGYQWFKAYQSNKKIPQQVLGFAIAITVIYLPSILLFPGWIYDWLNNLRQIQSRALAGFIPRLLILYFPADTLTYWTLLIVISIGVFLILFRYGRMKLTLDSFMLFSFVTNPFIHEYDLIQILPILNSTRQRILATLLSVPGWVVILTQYSSDTAWIVFILIVPGLLLDYLIQSRQKVTGIKAVPIGT